MSQQGDVSLFQTNDNGDISVTNGIVRMDSGLETSAYLSLFGGNEKDDGRKDNPDRWWGNIDEEIPARKYVSETQNLLRGIAATSGNLRRIEDAALRDLQWMIDEKIASSVEVATSIPAVNRLKLVVTIEAIGEESRFEFTENWRSAVT